MNVVPKSAPNIVSPSNAATSSRDRAMAAFNTPVPNPSQVSPEELGAVKAPSGQANESEPKAASPAPSEPPKEVKEAKSDAEPLSTQYAILAKKEKALRAKVQQQEQAYKAKEEALRQKEEALKSKESEYQNNYISKSKLSEDTITTLLEAGITYDQITQMALNQGQVQTDPQTKLAIQRLEAQVKAQAEAQENAQKAVVAEQQRQYQQAVSQIKAEARAIVNSDPNYETIKATNSVSDVVELIEKIFNEDGILLTVEEAAMEVENYLVEQALKISQLKKIQQKMQPKTQSSVQKQESNVQQSPQSIKTLTNSVGVSRPLSAKERAILAFKGELK